MKLWCTSIHEEVDHMTVVNYKLPAHVFQRWLLQYCFFGNYAVQISCIWILAMRIKVIKFCSLLIFVLVHFLCSWNFKDLHCSSQNMCFSNSSGERVQNKNLDQGFCFEMLHYFQCLILLHQWQLAVPDCRKHSQFQVLQLAWRLPAASLNLFMFVPLATSACSVHSWYQRGSVCDTDEPSCSFVIFAKKLKALQVKEINKNSKTKAFFLFFSIWYSADHFTWMCNRLFRNMEHFNLNNIFFVQIYLNHNKI